MVSTPSIQSYPHLKQENRIKIQLGSSINAITKVKTEKFVREFCGIKFMLINCTIFTPLISGSHCLDILFAEETDPEWLVSQRKMEIKIIKEWINNYYADLTKLQIPSLDLFGHNSQPSAIRVAGNLCDQIPLHFISIGSWYLFKGKLYGSYQLLISCDSLILL